MSINNKLKVGASCNKNDLSELLNEVSLKSCREGIYYCKNSNDIIFFVDLEKDDKRSKFHFRDYFEEELFHWDSQPKQHINTKSIQNIIKGLKNVHLFVRVKQKIKNKTQPFIYCGRLIYQKYDKDTANPVHILFHNIDYCENTKNVSLRSIYQWKPRCIERTEIDENKITFGGDRKTYKRPDETEIRRLVNTRVGQDYYRQQLIEKWGGVCPVTQCDMTEILIASHIIPWVESNNEEKLDPENGILLAPHIDALFDRHYISFCDDGNIIFSKKLKTATYQSLNLSDNIRINITDGMKEYLSKHRDKLVK